MFNYEVCGFSSFVSKKGVNYTVVYVQFKKDNVSGKATDKFFVQTDVIHGNLAIGSIVCPLCQPGSNFIIQLDVK